MAPVRISAANLWTYRVADTGGTEREPLSDSAQHGMLWGIVRATRAARGAGLATRTC
jgi:hypothetical protein